MPSTIYWLLRTDSVTRSSEKRKKAQASKPPLQIPSTMADSNYESSATGAELVRNASTWPVSSDATSDAPQEEGPAASDETGHVLALRTNSAPVALDS